MTRLGLTKFLKNIAATLGRQIASGFIQLITLAIIAREFGPSGNGIYTLTLLVPSMMAIFLSLGVDPANVYFLGAKKIHPKLAWKETLIISFWIILIVLLLGGFFIYFYSLEILSGVPKETLWLSLAIFPFMMIMGNINGFFQGLQDFKSYNIFLILQPVLSLSFLFLSMIYEDININVALFCYFLSMVITLIFAYKKLQMIIKDQCGPNLENYRMKLLNYGYKVHLSNILALINYRADVFIIGYFLGPAASGIFTIAVLIIEKLWLLSNAVSTVLLPKLSQLSNNGSKKAIITPLVAKFVLLLTFIASIILITIGEFIINMFFGSEYIEAYTCILYLSPGVIVGACSRVLANDIAARGKPELNLATSWITVTINIILNIYLIPIYGIQGAAIATSFAYVINFLMRLTMHNYLTKIPFYKNIVLNKADYHLLTNMIYQRNR